MMNGLNPAAKASLKKEWLRLSRSRAGRGGPTGLILVCALGMITILYSLANPEMQLTAAELAHNVSESRDTLLATFAFGLMLCAILAITAAMMAADLVSEERKSGTLQALRLTPISPFLVVSAKTLGTVCFQVFMFFCLSPIMIFVCGLMGVPMQLILLLFPYLLAISVAMSGLSAGLTASLNATAGKLLLVGMAVSSFIFSSVLVAEFGKLIDFFHFEANRLLPVVIILLAGGFLTWGLGVLAASRKLFNPGATPLSVGQAGLGGNLLMLVLLGVMEVPSFKNQLNHVDFRLMLIIFYGLLGLFCCWLTLAQCIPARHDLNLDWITLDGKMAHPGRAFYLCIGILTMSHLVGPARLLNLGILDFLGLGVWGISSSLFWLSISLWVAMAWSRVSASPGPYLFWLGCPFVMVIFSLEKFWGEGVFSKLMPLSYFFIVRDVARDSNPNPTIELIQYFGESSNFPFLEVALPFTFLLMAFIFSKLPLPKPKHSYLPKDFKALAQQ